MLACLSAPLEAARPAAIVNGQPIEEDELRTELEQQQRKPGGSPRPAGPVSSCGQEALNKGIDRMPDVKRDTDKILYRAFLDKSISEAGNALYPSDSEVQASIKRKRPLIRLRILSFYAKTPGRVEEGQAKGEGRLVSSLQRLDLQGSRVCPYSKDGSKQLEAENVIPRTGRPSRSDLCFRAIKLSKRVISPPIETESGVHLIQLVSRKRFSAAPSTYIDFLRGKLRAERENIFRNPAAGGPEEKG